MTQQLTINPAKLTSQQAHLQGKVALSHFVRLQEFLLNDQGDLEYDLQFGKDQQGRPFIKGKLKGTLMLACQRCGNPVAYVVSSLVSLSPIFSDTQSKNLPKIYDPLVTGGEPISLVDLIEEEVLLNLPMAVKHEDVVCGQKQPSSESQQTS